MHISELFINFAVEIKKRDMERTFIITYYNPLRYKGTYIVKGRDSFEASDKVKKYLIENFGETKDSYCVVSEVEDNKLIYV